MAPFLKGERVYLRGITEKDLTSTYRDWLNDEEVNRFNTHHRFPNYDENMRDYFNRVIESRENLVLAICDVGTQVHIGNVALQNIDLQNRSAELAILIGEKSAWGKGIGAEAATLILQHGFSELNLHRIYAGTEERNIGFQKLATRLGFTEEGRSRESVWKDGEHRDIINYGLLAHEWNA